MSDNVPFEIQMEIIEKVSDVKYLIQFRSVSKQWKSFIDSSEFIKGYGARHTQPHSRILMYRAHLEDLDRHICVVDDNMETLEVQKFVVSPLLKQYRPWDLVGTCHGLLCMYGFHKGYSKWMVAICNPSIRKSFAIAVVFKKFSYFGFGVCPITRDPTVVRILCPHYMPWHAEVFTLSSGVWNVIPSANLPRQSIKLNKSTKVVIDRFIYWGAFEITFADDGDVIRNQMVVSFDLIAKEFKVISLPDSLRNELDRAHVSVAKLRESLVVYGSTYVNGTDCCGVWVMEHDSSFRKLFTADLKYYKILGFKKNGETIFETRKEDEMFTTVVAVYDSCSQQIKNLGISGVRGYFFMGSYKESLLLDHSDSHIYCDHS